MTCRYCGTEYYDDGLGPALAVEQPNVTDKVIEEEIRFGDEWVGLVTRFLPNNAFEASVDLAMSADAALAELDDAARHVGRVIGRKVSDAGIRLTVATQAGFLNMMPAVVDIYVTALGDERCRVRIKGTSKETLIKQRSGEGAVRRLLAATRFGGSASPTAK